MYKWVLVLFLLASSSDASDPLKEPFKEALFQERLQQKIVAAKHSSKKELTGHEVGILVQQLGFFKLSEDQLLNLHHEYQVSQFLAQRLELGYSKQASEFIRDRAFKRFSNKGVENPQVSAICSNSKCLIASTIESNNENLIYSLCDEGFLKNCESYMSMGSYFEDVIINSNVVIADIEPIKGKLSSINIDWSAIEPLPIEKAKQVVYQQYKEGLVHFRRNRAQAVERGDAIEQQGYTWLKPFLLREPTLKSIQCENKACYLFIENGYFVEAQQDGWSAQALIYFDGSCEQFSPALPKFGVKNLYVKCSPAKTSSEWNDAEVSLPSLSDIEQAEFDKAKNMLQLSDAMRSSFRNKILNSPMEELLESLDSKKTDLKLAEHALNNLTMLQFKQLVKKLSWQGSRIKEMIYINNYSVDFSFYKFRQQLTPIIETGYSPKNIAKTKRMLADIGSGIDSAVLCSSNDCMLWLDVSASAGKIFNDFDVCKYFPKSSSCQEVRGWGYSGVDGGKRRLKVSIRFEESQNDLKPFQLSSPLDERNGRYANRFWYQYFTTQISRFEKNRSNNSGGIPTAREQAVSAHPLPSIEYLDCVLEDCFIVINNAFLGPLEHDEYSKDLLLQIDERCHTFYQTEELEITPADEKLFIRCITTQNQHLVKYLDQLPKVDVDYSPELLGSEEYINALAVLDSHNEERFFLKYSQEEEQFEVMENSINSQYAIMDYTAGELSKFSPIIDLFKLTSSIFGDQRSFIQGAIPSSQVERMVSSFYAGTSDSNIETLNGLQGPIESSDQMYTHCNNINCFALLLDSKPFAQKDICEYFDALSDQCEASSYNKKNQQQIIIQYFNIIGVENFDNASDLIPYIAPNLGDIMADQNLLINKVTDRVALILKENRFKKKFMPKLIDAQCFDGTCQLTFENAAVGRLNKDGKYSVYNYLQQPFSFCDDFDDQIVGQVGGITATLNCPLLLN